jgi:hypothetical protein
MLDNIGGLAMWAVEITKLVTDAREKKETDPSVKRVNVYIHFTRRVVGTGYDEDGVQRRNRLNQG